LFRTRRVCVNSIPPLRNQPIPHTCIRSRFLSNYLLEGSRPAIALFTWRVRMKAKFPAFGVTAAIVSALASTSAYSKGSAADIARKECEAKCNITGLPNGAGHKTEEQRGDGTDGPCPPVPSPQTQQRKRRDGCELRNDRGGAHRGMFQQELDNRSLSPTSRGLDNRLAIGVPRRDRIDWMLHRFEPRPCGTP
jgi:hypothetical protein